MSTTKMPMQKAVLLIILLVVGVRACVVGSLLMVDGAMMDPRSPL
jgi:hypothetical protein